MRMLSIMRRWGVVLIALGLGCSGDSTPPTAPEPASVAVAAGHDQVGPAGQALTDSLVVLVRDAAGAPLSEVTVTWQVTAGGGAVSPGASVTNASGLARTQYTLGANAGTNTARAAVGNLSPATFDAVAQIQGAVEMGSKTIGPLADTVHGTLTEFEQPLRVLVLDHLGVPVQGVVVNWTATGGGSVAAPTSLTDAGGEAMIEYTFGAEARTGYGATAAVPGLIGSPVVWFDMHATPGTPVVIAKTSGDGLVVQTGAPVVHTVTVRDSYGNGTQGVGIDWAIGSGSGSLFTTHNFTIDNGTADNRRTLGPELGNQTVTATAPSLPGAPVVTFTAVGAEHVVRVVNGVFVPDAVTVQIGDSVAWQWNGITDLHNITFAAVPGAPLSEPNRTSGVAWRVFAAAGTFAYRCTNHAGMTGSVTVVP